MLKIKNNPERLAKKIETLNNKIIAVTSDYNAALKDFDEEGIDFYFEKLEALKKELMFYTSK